MDATLNQVSIQLPSNYPTSMLKFDKVHTCLALTTSVVVNLFQFVLQNVLTFATWSVYLIYYLDAYSRSGINCNFATKINLYFPAPKQCQLLLCFAFDEGAILLKVTQQFAHNLHTRSHTAVVKGSTHGSLPTNWILPC